MKKILMSMIIGSIVFSGCSGKYPAMKTGAIIGGLTGVVTTVAVGTKDTNSDMVPVIVVVAVILGLAGTAAGAGIGYIVDISRDNDDEIKEIIHAENIEGLER